MSFIITYKFVILNDKKDFTNDLLAGVGNMLKSGNTAVELRAVKPPKESEMVIDPLILDYITTEVHHSISLGTDLPTWITDYFNKNENKTIARCRGGTVAHILLVQLISSKLKYDEMLINVNFEEIKIRQKWILGKLFAPCSHLPVIDIYQYDPYGKSIMSRPTRIGYFSIKISDQKGVFFSDKSQLRYFNPPTSADAVLDLTSGFNPKARYCRSPIERHIVRWYWENGTSMHAGNTVPTIITDLRTLGTIMASPTNSSENWEVVCCRFSGQIFMFEIDTKQRHKRVNNQDEFQNLSSFSGYRFEQLVTRRYDDKTCPIYYGGLRDSFYSVNTTNIGKHKVLYSARCAAASNKENMFELIDDMEMVEIKTRSGINSWESRVPMLWARSILNRVNTIHVGEKNADFMVTDITTIPTTQLLTKSYNTGVLFNFLHKTLDFITDTCKVEKGVYRFHRTPFLPVIVQKMDLSIESIIPQWYVSGECPNPSLPFMPSF